MAQTKMLRQLNFLSLSTTLRKSELESDDNIIIGGDFNCPLDPIKDKKGGILIPRQHLINSIENIQSEFSLHDILLVSHGAKAPLLYSADSITG